MKIKICININKLLPHMKDYEFRRIDTTWNDEDYCSKYSKYYIAKSNVFNVTISASTFSEMMYLTFADGTEIELWGNNINTHDTTLLRINHTEYISPELIVNGELVELTSDFIQWTKEIFNFTEEQLENMSEKLYIDEEIEYPGVCTPVRCGGSWAYSSKPLVLKTSEIEIVLNSIKDEELRRKIECVLTARVFKKR